MLESLITVIVPVYNTVNFLDKCLSSIINQTYKHLEIIVIDDGSTDGSEKKCDEYERRDSRIKVIHKINEGVSKARNYGISIARGDFIGFVDSDDYLAPDMYELLLNAIDQNEADLSICNVNYVDEKYNAIERAPSPIVDEIISGKAILRERMFQKNGHYYVLPVTKLYRKWLFDSAHFPLNTRYEDELILHKILIQCEKVACISEPLYFYVQRSDGFMNTAFNDYRVKGVEALFSRASFLANYEDMSDCAAKTLLWGVYGYYGLCEKGFQNYRETVYEVQKCYNKSYEVVKPCMRGLSGKQKFFLGLNRVSIINTWRVANILK